MLSDGMRILTNAMLNAWHALHSSRDYGEMPTPLRLTTLPDDALAIVAARIVLDGESYWFAATCRAARNAVRTACKEFKLEKPTSNVRTIFSSLPRLRAGLRLTSVQDCVLANRRAACAQNLPTSMDGLYTWTPSAARAITAGATVDVLNYVWPSWTRSINNLTNPVCAIEGACWSGRTDLLDEIYNVLPADNWDTKCLQRIMRLAVEGHPDSRRHLLRVVFRACVFGANTASATWLYDKLEEIGDVVGEWDWRSWLMDRRIVLELTGDACKAFEPRESLRLLTNWMLPRFASRAVSDRLAPKQAMISSVLIYLAESLSFRVQTRRNGWEWLSEAWPLGLGHLLRHIHSSAPQGTNRVAITTLHRNCFRIVDVGTYQWMRDQLEPTNGWMYHAVMFHDDYVLWTTSKELESLRSRESCCSAEWRFAMHVHHRIIRLIKQAQSAGERRQLWTVHRELLIESFADCMLYYPDDEKFQAHYSTWSPCFGCLSACAFSESVNIFQRYATPRQRDLIACTLINRITAHWLVMREEKKEDPESTDQFGERAPFFDSDEEDSCAFEHISSLRGHYYWEDLYHGGGPAAAAV